MKFIALVLMLVLPILAHNNSYAHSSSEAYLSLDIKGNQATGGWEFSLRDLEYVVGLDANGDGKISWQEIKQRTAVVQGYIVSGVNISQGQQACTINPGTLMLNNRQGTVFLYQPVNVVCQKKIAQLKLDYQLFFNQDARHHAVWSLTANTNTLSRISSADNRMLLVDLNTVSFLQGFIEFFVQGVWHIWIGLDHILFLVLLILAIENSLSGVQQSAKGKQRWWRVIKTVTAFTVAHSVTLALASSGWLILPSYWVESIIALSVILAGLNVLFKWVEERLWLFAFIFGLIHGFGFASVLLDLGLQGTNLLMNILAFNAGVEAGQLLIVIVAIPVIAVLGRLQTTGVYIKHIVTVMVIMLASVWFVQRLSV